MKNEQEFRNIYKERETQSKISGNPISILLYSAHSLLTTCTNIEECLSKSGKQFDSDVITMASLRDRDLCTS